MCTFARVNMHPVWYQGSTFILGIQLGYQAWWQVPLPTGQYFIFNKLTNQISNAYLWGVMNLKLFTSVE